MDESGFIADYFCKCCNSSRRGPRLRIWKKMNMLRMTGCCGYGFKRLAKIRKGQSFKDHKESLCYSYCSEGPFKLLVGDPDHDLKTIEGLKPGDLKENQNKLILQF